MERRGEIKIHSPKKKNLQGNHDIDILVEEFQREECSSLAVQGWVTSR